MEALTPHDNACTNVCWPPRVGPALQLFHVVASGFGAPEILRERTMHVVSSYAVMVTDTPISGMGAGGALEHNNFVDLVPLAGKAGKQMPDGAEFVSLDRALMQLASLKS